MKRILITGANSYIGESVKIYLGQYPDRYLVDILNTLGLEPTSEMFSKYDVVFNVAGIAHIKETEENRQLYYDINCDFAVNMAKAAKEGGVRQFIHLSSMSVYGLTEGYITKNMMPNPVNAYGESKLMADEKIRKLEDENFKFVCLRPPMVYGKGCKGNYQTLRSFALKSPVFPLFRNQRSMIFIDNLSEFIKEMIDGECAGLFFPQNEAYVCTCEMVRLISNFGEKKIKLLSLGNPLIHISKSNLVKKVFGSLTYEKVDIFSKFNFYESIELTER